VHSADPFPASDFDQWAPTYDADVLTYDAFPFAGYEQVLDAVVALADARKEMQVLDLGTGTGNLALRFAALGCRLWCTDYSGAMLSKARQKLPQAHLVQHDWREAWPPELDRRFDRIVSAYALHHLELDAKITLLANLVRRHLSAEGALIIGDISFPTGEAMTEFAESIGDAWEWEPYWLADEAQAALQKAALRSSYRQVSPCAGVYRIESA